MSFVTNFLSTWGRSNVMNSIVGRVGTLLEPYSPILQHYCGMKVKGKPKLRCKDCYKVYRDDRLYVMCKTHPRHKQTEIKKKPKNTWILTHATQSKQRPW